MSLHMPSKITELNGTTEISNGKYFLAVPSSYSQDLMDKLSESTFTYDKTNEFELCGVGKCSELKRPVLVINEAFVKKLSYVVNTTAKVYDANGNILYDNFTPERYSSITKNKLIVPENTGVSSVKIVVNSYEFDVDNLEIEVRETAVNPTLSYTNDVFDNSAYELSIYSNDFKNIERICRDNGYSFIYPAKMGSTVFSLSFIGFIMQAVFSSLLMLVLVFISFVVLSRVYQSKKADYGIMRSLGLLKSQMAVIVRYEMLSIGMTASIFAIIVFVILSLFIPDYAQMLGNASFIFYILFCNDGII